MSQLTEARAVFRAERRPDMAPGERVGLAFRSGRVASDARRDRAFRVLDACRSAYGAAFESVMRAPTDECRRLALLRAARRYRLVTWVLLGLPNAHRITAWRFALDGEWARAEGIAS